MSYLSKFYNAGLAAPSEYAIGGVYKGFNDTLASWGTGRIVGQQCGQTWLQTFSQINNFYSSGNQLDAVQLVTWNDYEEGTEIESGIDNCVSITAKLVKSAVQWTVTGNENTIDHYVVYISADGKNLMALTTVQPGLHSLDLGSYQLAGGNYVAYVQAVGKPTMINHMSGAVNYTSVNTASGGGNGGGGGTTSGSISLGATPTTLTLAPGQSGNTNLTITPVSGPVTTPVVLSCSNLPSGTACAFSTNSITPGSSVMSAVVTISAANAIADARGGSSRKGSNPAGGLLFSGLGVMAIAVSGSWYTRKQIRKGILILGITILVSLLSSCGGGSPVGLQSSTAQVRSGSFTVTINGDSGSQHSSTTLYLTIR
jgi:hypothetical protein